MREGQCSPYNTVRYLMAKASQYAWQDKHLPTFRMSEDGKSFTVFAKTLSLDVLANGYQRGLDDLDHLLRRLTDDIPSWAFEKLKEIMHEDSFTKDDPDYSFLSMPELVELRSLGHQAKLGNRDWWILCDDGHTLRWNMAKVKVWMSLSREAQALIIVLIHIGCGQPARATELTSLLIRNLQNGHRSLFMTPVDGLVSIIGYNKVRILL